ncbi:MAG: DUF11 domain-containing protein, partial [Planctomycetes bacterium]|nr:DUF11 domain-containing protein [Planctomycetota bacterium]
MSRLRPPPLTPLFFLLAAALALAGAPARGQVPFFTRGDANADGRFQISDPIAVLGFLFLGSPAQLPCDDAADGDDSGGINLTDAVFDLSFLFLGGAAPPAPFPDCGPDPTADSLRCAAFAPCEQPSGLDVTPEAGGTLRSEDGRLTLDVPAGAVAEPVRIRVRKLSFDEIPADIRGGDGPPDAAWELEPDGLVFETPIRVRYEAQVEEVRDLEDPAARVLPLPVLVLRSSDGRIEQAGAPDLEIDLEAGTLAAAGDVAHFSVVAVKNSPLRVRITPDSDTRTVGESLFATSVTFSLDRSWQPCGDCDPLSAGTQFTFREYDVVSTDPLVLTVVDHQDLRGATVGSIAASDLPLVLCDGKGSAQWGPVFSGRWDEPEDSPRFFPRGGTVSAKVRARGECNKPPVELRKEPSRDRVSPGDLFTYSISARFPAGPMRLTGLKMEDVVPPGLEILYVTDGGERREGNAIVWPAGALADLEKSDSFRRLAFYAVRVLDVFPPGEHLVANTVELETKEAGLVTAASTVTVVKGTLSALAIDRANSAFAGTVSPSEHVDVDISVINIGRDPLADISLREELDFPTSFPLILPPGRDGAFDGASNSITWKIGSLGPGESTRVHYIRRAPDDLPDLIELRSIELVSRATASAAGDDMASAEESILVDPVRRTPLAVTKTDLTGGVATPGETVTYQVFLQNFGQAPLTDLFVIDDLFNPELVSSVQEISHGGSFEPVARVVWSELPDLGPGELIVLSYSVTLLSDFPQLPAYLFNRALASAAETHPRSSASSHVLEVRKDEVAVTDDYIQITGPDGAFVFGADAGTRRVVYGAFDEALKTVVYDLDLGRLLEIPLPEDTSVVYHLSPDDGALVGEEFGNGIFLQS